MRHHLPVLLLVLAAAFAKAEEAAPKPELTISMRDGTTIVAWAASESFPFESDLGKHDLKWPDVVQIGFLDGCEAQIDLKDATRLKGRFAATEIPIRKGGGISRAVEVAKVQRISVLLLTRPSGTVPARVLASASEFGCGGIARGADGRIAALDRAESALVLLDAETLKESGRLKLGARPSALAAAPDGSRYAVTCGPDLLWINARSTAIETRVNLGAEARTVGVLSESTAIAGTTTEVIAVSLSKGAVVARAAIAPGRIIGRIDEGRVLTSVGILCLELANIDLGKPPLFVQYSSVHSFDLGNSFLSGDARFAVTWRGEAYRLGRGAGTAFAMTASLSGNTCGVFGPEDRTVVLFSTDGKMSTYDFATGEIQDVRTTNLNVYAAFPVRDGKAVCVLARMSPQATNSLPTEFFENTIYTGDVIILALDD